jgi:hypothetical protein
MTSPLLKALSKAQIYETQSIRNEGMEKFMGSESYTPVEYTAEYLNWPMCRESLKRPIDPPPTPGRSHGRVLENHTLSAAGPLSLGY